MYVEVVVNLPVESTFHYHIPPELAGRLKTGHLVEVTFGRQKAQAIVLRLDRRSPVADTRPVERIIDRQPVIDSTHLALADWMSERYLARLSDCVRLFLPPGLSKRGDVLITPVIEPAYIKAQTDNQQRVLSLLSKKGALRGRQIARSLSRRDWRGAVTELVERGVMLREPLLDPPTVKAKQVRVVDLAVPPEQVEEIVSQHFNPADLPSNRRAAAERRGEILHLMARARKPLQVGDIYAAVEKSSITDLRVLVEDDLIVVREEEVWRDPLQEVDFTPDQPPGLTPDQMKVWDVIHHSMEHPDEAHPVLLHGVTGSGKTEIYLRAVEHALKQGKTAIVLVPEIALTPQTIRRFGARFPGRMGLIHSQLSPGERYDTWRRARNGQIDVVVGPRSALFTPLKNIGVIVIDECHDDSYKQTPPVDPPYYHTLPTAIELARLNQGLVIMGSATPNVATYARASRPDQADGKPYMLLELPARIMGHRQAIEAQAIHYQIARPRYTHLPEDPEEAVMIGLPPVQVVDMRHELRAGNRSIFSRSLTAAMQGTLDRGEQAILFLNRRGSATYVFCRSCGHTMVCPSCDVPLTWHLYKHSDDQGKLVCHHCDHREDEPETCPECGSAHIKYFGGGTERVEAEVRRQFPDARVIRWDTDTTGGKDTHMELLETFIKGDANVLVGTQMVAKGLDLPLVTLVGVISADTALYLPDYRSGERTFQLLTQVAGRAGRGLLGGQVILQTYNPEHYAIQAAAHHDFHTFYEQELAYRGELRYPPYSHLVRLVIEMDSSEKAEQTAQKLHQKLSQHIVAQGLTTTSLIGPAPCFYPRRGNLFCWHLIVRGENPLAALQDVTPSRVLHIDVDPVSLL